MKFTRGETGQKSNRTTQAFFFPPYLSINRLATGCRADLSKRQTFVCRYGDMTSRGSGVRKKRASHFGIRFSTPGICGSRRRISARIACHQILTRHPTRGKNAVEIRDDSRQTTLSQILTVISPLSRENCAQFLVKFARDHGDRRQTGGTSIFCC